MLIIYSYDWMFNKSKMCIITYEQINFVKDLVTLEERY